MASATLSFLFLVLYVIKIFFLSFDPPIVRGINKTRGRSLAGVGDGKGRGGEGRGVIETLTDK